MFDAQLERLSCWDGCGNFAPDAGAVAECSALGGKVRFDEHGYISVAPAEIEELDDVLAIKPVILTATTICALRMEQLEYMVEHCPAGYKVNPHAIMGPFTVGAQLRGISDFCADTIADPDLVWAILDLVIETQVNFIRHRRRSWALRCTTSWCATTYLPSQRAGVSGVHSARL